MPNSFILKKLPYLIFTLVSAIVLTNLKFLLPFFTQDLYYTSLFFILSIIILQTKIRHVNPKALILIVATALSLWVNSPPEYFQSKSRWVAWLLIFLLFGPVFRSQSFSYFRFNSFQWILKLCEIVGVGSFIWYILGFPNLGRGIFTGLTFHSMVLGPVAGIACISIVNRIMYSKYKNKKNIFYLFLFLSLFFSSFSLLLSSSRVAVIATIFSVFICLFIKYKNTKLLFFGGLIALLILSISNFYGTQTKKITDGLSDKGLTSNSRNTLWDERIYEFKTSPIFGIGFASSLDKSSILIKESGSLEPGSSWLAILAMTGILGFLSFSLLMLETVMKVLKNFHKNRSMKYSVYFGTLIFFSISFFAEGYVFAAGSPLALIFWMTLGVSMDKSIQKKIKTEGYN